MDKNAFRGQNAYVLFRTESNMSDAEPSMTAINDVVRAYWRLIEQRGWKTDRLDASVSWLKHDISTALWVRGWEAYGVLSDEPKRHCGQYPRPGGKGGTLEICVHTYVVPEAVEYEWQPFLRDVQEWIFYSHWTSVKAAVRLYHKPTDSIAECREVDPVYDLSRGKYTLQCNRQAAWSFLLDHLRNLDTIPPPER